MKRKPTKAGMNFVSTVCAKRRALARSAGSAGSRPASGKTSARYSRMMRDSGRRTVPGAGFLVELGAALHEGRDLTMR